MKNVAQKNEWLNLPNLALAIMATALLINLLSVYIRHTEAGLACNDRGECYGNIGAYVNKDSSIALLRDAFVPAELAKRSHRVFATGLVVLVLLLLHRTRQHNPLRGFAATIPYLLAAAVIALAVLGPASYLKTRPAIASGNLIGGMLLVALAWWLWLALRDKQSFVKSLSYRLWARAALATVAIQIALGAWVSSNYSGLVCDAGLVSATCHDSGSTTQQAPFWYFRQLVLDDTGRVIQDQSAAWIHLAHRAFAWLTALTLIAVLIRYWTVLAARPWLIAIAVLLATQFALGLTMLAWQLPLLLVIGHYLIATLLLLSVLRINY